MKKIRIKTMLLVSAPLMLAALLTGCSFATPTASEKVIYDTTTVQMPTVAPVQRVVTKTNIIDVQREVIQTNTVTFTNVQNQIVPIYIPVTNQVIDHVQVVSKETNTLPVGTMVDVPQLAAPKPVTVATTGIVANVINALGPYGTLLSFLITGGLAAYQKVRNAKLAAVATGASASASLANQVAGGLTQNIETLMTILQNTPQGQALMPGIKAYLVKHQTEAGTFQAVAQLIEDYVDVPAAKESAGSVLQALATLNPPAPVAPVPVMAVK